MKKDGKLHFVQNTSAISLINNSRVIAKRSERLSLSETPECPSFIRQRQSETTSTAIPHHYRHTLAVLHTFFSLSTAPANQRVVLCATAVVISTWVPEILCPISQNQSIFWSCDYPEFGAEFVQCRSQASELGQRDRIVEWILISRVWNPTFHFAERVLLGS